MGDFIFSDPNLWISPWGLGIVFLVMCWIGHYALKCRIKTLQGLPRVCYLIGFLLIGLSYFPFKLASDGETHRVETSLKAFAPAYALAHQELGLTKLNPKTSPENKDYLKLVDLQKSWVEQNPKIADIYTFYRDKDGKTFFLVDSETDYDRDGIYGGDREERTEIGEPYEDEDLELDHVYATGETVFSPEIVTDKWGTWVSAYAPVKNTDGSISHVLGLDFPAEELIRRVLDARLAVFLGFLAGLLLVFGFSFTFRVYTEDLKKQVALQKELSQSQTRNIASAKLAALGEMAAGIAHEINNPLAAIEGRIQLLKSRSERGLVTKEVLSENLEKISGMVFRCAKIIKGLKAFSRDGSNDPMEWVPLDQIIRDTLEFCSERFKKHGVELTLLPTNPGISLECRASEISQVFLNLLNNAFDAARSQSDKWVKFETDSSSPTHFRIAITDSGRGIAPEVAEKMLQPFFTTKENGQGTGLGLSISHQIISSHGGKILYNNQNPNTQFIIEFPSSKTKSLKSAEVA